MSKRKRFQTLRGRLGRPPFGQRWQCIGYANSVERGARWVIWRGPLIAGYVDLKVHADGRVDGKANYRVTFNGERFAGRDAPRLAVDLPHVCAEALALARYLYTADML